MKAPLSMPLKCIAAKTKQKERARELARDAVVVVGSDVALLSQPAPTQTLVLQVFIGPKANTVGYPQASDARTHLLAEDRLCDARRVWLTYCYVQTRTVGIPRSQFSGRVFGSIQQIETARVLAPVSNSDGSLGFFDTRIERRHQAAPSAAQSSARAVPQMLAFMHDAPHRDRVFNA
jgi:hypothetical protein